MHSIEDREAPKHHSHARDTDAEVIRGFAVDGKAMRAMKGGRVEHSYSGGCPRQPGRASGNWENLAIF